MSEQLSGNSGYVRCPEWVGGYMDSSPCELLAGHEGDHERKPSEFSLLGSFKVNPAYRQVKEIKDVGHMVVIYADGSSSSRGWGQGETE